MASLGSVKTIILVGGEGLRLRPLTLTIPKPMLPLFDRPLIAWLLRYVADSGLVDEMILASGYRAEAFEGLPGFSCPLRLEPEERPLGTGGALARLRGRLEGTVLVLNGDGLLDVDLPAMLAFHRQRRASVTLAAVPLPDVSQSGALELGAEDRLTAFREKDPRGGPGWINAGLYLMEAEVLDLLPSEGPSSLERDLFPRLLGEGLPLYGFRHAGYFRDLGTPQSYLQAHEDLLRGVSRFPRPAASGEVWFGPGAAVDPSSTVLGPSALGAGSRVGPGCMVRRCVLGAGATVGAGARLEDCLLAPGARVPSDARLQGAVLA